MCYLSVSYWRACPRSPTPPCSIKRGGSKFCKEHISRGQCSTGLAGLATQFQENEKRLPSTSCHHQQALGWRKCKRSQISSAPPRPPQGQGQIPPKVTCSIARAAVLLLRAVSDGRVSRGAVCSGGPAAYLSPAPVSASLAVRSLHLPEGAGSCDPGPRGKRRLDSSGECCALPPCSSVCFSLSYDGVQAWSREVTGPRTRREACAPHLQRGPWQAPWAAHLGLLIGPTGVITSPALRALRAWSFA